MIPNKNGGFQDVAQAQDFLTRLTLRQLRHMASDLGVSLYSRKTKAALVKAIAQKQEKKTADIERQSEDPVISEEQTTQGNSTSVVFVPRDPEWAYVFWDISEADRESAISRGASRLCLRLTDVTTNETRNINQQTLQEVTVDSHSTEWYLPIPLCDRDYRIELGYRVNKNWMSLAFSKVARVPAQHPSNQILDEFVPFSLNNTSSSGDFVADNSIQTTYESRDSGLHERLYQRATTHVHKKRIGSEEFQENTYSHTHNKGINDSGIGLWASGRNESGIGGVFQQKEEKPFWLVADAELIVYGSTDPSARLTIGGEEVPLTSEGTFRLQVPFRDGQQNYPIKATAANGDQFRNITLTFERVTPEDNSSPKINANSDWF